MSTLDAIRTKGSVRKFTEECSRRNDSRKFWTPGGILRAAKIISPGRLSWGRIEEPLEST